MSKTPFKFDDPFYDRLNAYLDISNGESDRGRVLVASALLDEMLAEILQSYLLESAPISRLFDDAYAPLSSLSAKAAMARSLSLITALEFRDIDLARKIRNEFAHTFVCSFEDAKIASRCRQLKTGIQYLDDQPEGHKSRVGDAKARFSMVMISLISALYNRAHYAKKARLHEKNWPN